MNKKEKTAMLKQMTKDRDANPESIGTVWCNEHDCRPGTCFLLHYPEASSKRTKVNYG